VCRLASDRGVRRVVTGPVSVSYVAGSAANLSIGGDFLWFGRRRTSAGAGPGHVSRPWRIVGYLVRVRSSLARALASALDVCCVLAFVAIGRHTHGYGDSVAGIWHTGWPFLAGLAIGLAAGWRAPAAGRVAGVLAWVGAAGAGMLIRVVAGQGTAADFIAVTFAFLGLFILGWRFAVMAARHLRRTSIPTSQRG
jgi:hypothetical protein